MFGRDEQARRVVNVDPGDAARLPWQYLSAEGCDEDGLFYLISPSGERHLGACFMTQPLVGGGGAEFRKVQAVLGNGLPPGSFIQIALFASPHINTYVEEYDNRKRQSSGLLRSIIQRRSNMFMQGVEKQQFRSNPVRNRDFQLYFSVKVPCSVYPDAGERENAMASIMRIIEGFAAIGFSFDRLDETGYLALLRTIYHMWEPGLKNYNELIPVREQAFYPSDQIEFGRDEITFHGDDPKNKFYVGIMSPKLYPRRTAFGVMDVLAGDRQGSMSQIADPFIMQLAIHYPDQIKKKADVTRRRMWITHQCIGNSIRWFPILGNKKEGMDVMQHEIDNQGGMVIEANVSIALFSRTKEELEKQTSMLNSYYSTVSFDMRPDRRILNAMWHNIIPLNPSVDSITRTFRYNTMSTRQASVLAPIFADWRGTGYNSTSIFTTRRGQVSPVSLWDSASGYSAVMFAGTGGGKSFLAQLLLVDNLAEGAKIWVIDAGQSFYKLCKLLDGDYMEFSEESNVILNPFSFVDEIDEDIDYLKASFAKMAAPEGVLDDYQMASLEEGIKATWDLYAHHATVTSLASWCHEQPDVRIRDMGTQLFPFTRDGSYGRWFEGDSNIDISNPLTVLELQHLKARPTLQKVVLLQLMGRIASEMFVSKNRGRKMLFLDEAWDLMDDPTMAKAIEALYRKVRKSNGSVIFISQGIGDLYTSPNGRAVVANSAWQIILEQRSESVDDAIGSGKLAMDSYGASQIKSLHTNPGEYSEFMIKRSESDWGIVRFRPDPFMTTLFASSGDERDDVIEAIEAGEDPEQVVEAYTQRRLENKG